MKKKREEKFKQKLLEQKRKNQKMELYEKLKQKSNTVPKSSTSEKPILQSNHQSKLEYIVKFDLLISTNFNPFN
jgi:hypothetical protein